MSTDRRDQSHQWWTRFDEKKMIFIIENGEGEEIEIPAKFEVCDTCEGKGSHVNPSIDAHGISREEFDEDPDFADAYFRGDYDQPCNECHGERVAPVVDEDHCPPALLKKANSWIEDFFSYRRECEAERRMGA